MADVFISYKQSERPAVEQIATRLRALGLSVWFDASLNAGESFSDEIDREARGASVILVCWSPVARQSRWVKAEAMIGFERDRLAACYVAGSDGFSPPTPFNTTHTVDLRGWLATPSDAHKGWRSILRRTARLCGRSDIETWCALDSQSTAPQLRAWIAAHSESPLFMAVDAQLRAREEQDAQREQLERVARERRAREEAKRRANEEEERRAREEAERLAEEAATRAREEEERERQEAHRQRVGERERQRRRVVSATTWALAVGAVWTIAWSFMDRLTVSERAIAAPEAAARRAEQQAFTDASQSRELRVGTEETLDDLLRRGGASPEDARVLLAAIGEVYDLNRLRSGQAISLYFRRNGDATELTGVAFRSEPGASVIASRTTSGGFEVREVLMPVTFEIARIAAPVETNLYSSALALGATDREVAALADAFAYDVDFQRDVRPGDDFELVFERYYDDEGNTVRTGDLLFVLLESSRGTRALYQFMAPGDARPDWYDARGRSPSGRNLTGRAFQLFTIERQRIDTLRQVRAREVQARTAVSQR